MGSEMCIRDRMNGVKLEAARSTMRKSYRRQVPLSIAVNETFERPTRSQRTRTTATPWSHPHYSSGEKETKCNSPECLPMRQNAPFSVFRRYDSHKSEANTELQRGVPTSPKSRAPHGSSKRQNARYVKRRDGPTVRYHQQPH